MIIVKDLSKVYNKGKSNAYEALHHISFKIADKERVALMGKSGAGKSTLLHILACIDEYDEGDYILNSKQIKNLSDQELASIRSGQLGLVMQDYALIDDFTGLENVLLPIEGDKKKKKKEKKELALEALGAVDMRDYAHTRISELSGGQKQRVAIARAIVNDPDVILADEPTGALDSVNADAIMDLFDELGKKGKTIIIVTHDMDIAKRCNRIIEIADGKIVENE